MNLFETLQCQHCGANLNNFADATVCPRCNQNLSQSATETTRAEGRHVHQGEATGAGASGATGIAFDFTSALGWYLDAYRVATATVTIGQVIKVVAICLAGLALILPGLASTALAQGNGAGAPDRSFASLTNLSAAPGLVANVSSIAIQADGRALVAGAFSKVNGLDSSSIARLNQDGTLDSSFRSGTSVNYTVNQVALQPDGKIIIVGGFTQVGSQARNRIARLNADGSLDPTFNPGAGANAPVNAAVVRTDGRILIGGAFTAYNGVARKMVALINGDGSLNASLDIVKSAFFGLADGTVNALSLQPDGKLLIGGAITFWSSVTSIHNQLIRLNSDWSWDDGFLNADNNPRAREPDAAVKAIALQPDGRIIIGGNFSLFGSLYQRGIARLLSDGSFDGSFNPGKGSFGGGVSAILVQPDGLICVAGDFQGMGGINQRLLARLQANGSFDTAFLPSFAAGSISALARQTDGKIIVGGSFFRPTNSNPIFVERSYGAPMDLPGANLRPFQPIGWSDKIIASTGAGTLTDAGVIWEAQDIYVSWAVTNDSTNDITERFYCKLSVDGAFKNHWYSDGLKAGYYVFIKDYNIGKLAQGDHTLRIDADSGNALAESDEMDNSYTKTITVVAPGTTAILRQPLSQIVGTGMDVVFFVVVAGDPMGTGDNSISYQWQRNGVDVPGQTHPGLVLTNVSKESEGSYSVSVRNAAGTTTSRKATLTVEPTDSLDKWAERSSGVTGNILDVAHGSNMFVAVGALGGKVLTSRDGTTWTPKDTGVPISLSGIVFNHEVFVAVGSDAILTSSDGVTWSLRDSRGATGINSVSFGRGLFVAVADAGIVLSSPDGIVWSRANSGASVQLRGGAYGNGMFVAVGDYGTIVTSPDGVSWTQRNAGVSSYLYDVAFGNGTFVTAGPEGPLVLTSADGVGWTKREIGVPGVLLGVNYGGGMFFLVGYDGLVTSKDGAAWRRRNLRSAA